MLGILITNFGSNRFLATGWIQLKIISKKVKAMEQGENVFTYN